MLEHEEWLFKARQDLKSAKYLSNAEDSLFDTAIYHTQQCAEKALKGYLVFKKHPVTKTHDLHVLIQLCLKFDQDFLVLKDDARCLNPYATEFRYPDDILVPDEEEVAQAIRIAQTFFNIVKDKIEKEHGEVNLDIFS